MDLHAVMEEIAARLDTIDGLRVWAYPADSVTPPAAVVSLPETYTYDVTFGRGTDRLTLPVVLLVGRASDRSAARRLAAYTDGSGASSIKQAVEAGTPTAFDTVRVMSAEFEPLRMNDIDYLGATLSLDIVGPGSP